MIVSGGYKAEGQGTWGLPAIINNVGTSTREDRIALSQRQGTRGLATLARELMQWA